MEFLEEEKGDEFLEEAIICPVPGCLNKGHIFKKYNIYVTHYTGSWRIFFMFTCPKFKVKETDIQYILNECISLITIHLLLGNWRKTLNLLTLKTLRSQVRDT